MKTKFVFLLLAICFSFSAWAQNHVGTWRLAAASYTNAQMKRESIDRSDVDELKIITPTHFTWMSQVPDPKDKTKKVFGGAGGGRYSLNGIKYIETLEYASWEGYESNITDFSLRVEEDTMYQMGALSNAEGAKTIIEEVWQRENFPDQNGKHVGTWHLVSQQVTNPTGEKSTTDMTKHKKVKIITPTHWMYIAQAINDDKKEFLKAAGGRYTLNGTSYSEQVEFDDKVKTDYTLRVDGDKLYLVGSTTDGEGRKYMYDEVYQREKDMTKKMARK